MKVYWAPVFQDSNNIDWNMMYYDIQSLYEHARPDMVQSTGNKRENFFYCPAFQDVTKNTFVLVNPIKTHVLIKDGQIFSQHENYVSCNIQHPPSMQDRLLLNYGLKWVFFCEHDISMSLTGPHFSNISYNKHGVVVPGRLNVGSWFRAVNCEFNLWPGHNEFLVEKHEHLAYVHFETDEKVELVRFEMNARLLSYCAATATSSSWESMIPLADRYKRFKRSRTNRLVITEIEKNLIK